MERFNSIKFFLNTDNQNKLKIEYNEEKFVNIDIHNIGKNKILFRMDNDFSIRKIHMYFENKKLKTFKYFDFHNQDLYIKEFNHILSNIYFFKNFNIIEEKDNIYYYENNKNILLGNFKNNEMSIYFLGSIFRFNFNGVLLNKEEIKEENKQCISFLVILDYLKIKLGKKYLFLQKYFFPAYKEIRKTKEELFEKNIFNIVLSYL